MMVYPIFATRILLTRRSGNKRGDRFGKGHSNPFGQQFSEHDADKSDADQHNPDHIWIGVRLQNFYLFKKRLQVLSQIFSTVDTKQNTDQCDANLYSGQQSAR